MTDATSVAVHDGFPNITRPLAMSEPVFVAVAPNIASVLVNAYGHIRIAFYDGETVIQVTLL